MNRRADIPVTVLVIGVFFICALALLSFYNSNIKVRNSFVGIRLMNEMNSQIEQTLFDGKNPAGLYLEKKGKGKLLELERVEEFPYFKRKEKILFSAEYKFAP